MLLGLLQAAWREYQRDRAQYLASAMVYYAIVSLVPLCSLLLSAIGLLLRFSPVVADAEQKMMLHLETHLGIQFLAVIRRVLEKLQRESIVGSYISLGGFLIAASVLFRHLRLSFRAIWNCEQPLVSRRLPEVVRSIIREKIVSVVMVLGAAGLLLAAVVLSVALEWSVLGSLTTFNLRAGWSFAAAGSFALDTITFALLLKLLPPVPVRLRNVWFAALICAVVWVAADEFLTLFGVFFAYDRSIYGAIGGVLVAMLWMNIVSQAFFFGAELCKVSVKSSRKEQLTSSAMGC